MLNDLIDTERAKSNKACELVKDYQNHRLSHNPKEYNTDDALIYECPECTQKTLILSDKEDSFFICTHCGNKKDASRCDVARACPGHVLIPICYLKLWNREHRSMICDECHDLFESQLRYD